MIKGNIRYMDNRRGLDAYLLHIPYVNTIECRRPEYLTDALLWLKARRKDGRLISKPILEKAAKTLMDNPKQKITLYFRLGKIPEQFFRELDEKVVVKLWPVLRAEL